MDNLDTKGGCPCRRHWLIGFHLSYDTAKSIQDAAATIIDHTLAGDGKVTGSGRSTALRDHCNVAGPALFIHIAIRYLTIYITKPALHINDAG